MRLMILNVCYTRLPWKEDVGFISCPKENKKTSFINFTGGSKRSWKASKSRYTLPTIRRPLGGWFYHSKKYQVGFYPQPYVHTFPGQELLNVPSGPQLLQEDLGKKSWVAVMDDTPLGDKSKTTWPKRWMKTVCL